MSKPFMNSVDARTVRLWALLPLLMAIMLGGFMMYALTDDKDGKTIPSPFEGKPLPQIKSTLLLDGSEFDSKKLLGQPFIVNVWGSWCVACAQEHPVLNKYAAQSDAIALVGLNHKEENREDGLAWLQKLGNPYRYVVDDQSGRIGIDLGVYGAPESYFVDAQGIVRYKHIGPITLAELNTKVEALRASKPLNSTR